MPAYSHQLLKGNMPMTAATAALGAAGEDVVVRRDVTYLVQNGIDPHDAVERVLAHRRSMAIWGRVFIFPLFWTWVFFIFGATGLPPAVANLLVGPGEVGQLLEASVYGAFALFGAVTSYALLLYPVRSWRRCARGIPEIDRRNRWVIRFRRPLPKGWKDQAPAERRDSRVVLVLVLFGAVVFLPVLLYSAWIIVLSFAQAAQILAGGGA